MLTLTSKRGRTMALYLLDTNHAGLLLRDPQSALWGRLATLGRDECVLCRPSVAELWFMVFNSTRPEANRLKLEALIAQFTILEFDAPAAVEFGLLRADLRRKGRPIPTFDILIAAIARVHDRVLVTADSHFAHIDELRIENWLTA